ncbi:MAG TPA: hypothetical protein VK477_09265 [Acidobacteriota bacterium]|nr:hypothetical protein [Acidobacteriota bacterium]
MVEEGSEKKLLAPGSGASGAWSLKNTGEISQRMRQVSHAWEKSGGPTSELSRGSARYENFPPELRARERVFIRVRTSMPRFTALLRRGAQPSKNQT